MRILVVEDEADLNLLKQTLRSEGYREPVKEKVQESDQ